MGRLDDKVAIVTGGATGIGKAITYAFVDEGAAVAIAARNLARLEEVAKDIKSKGGKIIAIQADISDLNQVQRMVFKTIRRFGKIDILVNNAGLLFGTTQGQFVDIPLDEWDRMLDVNTKGCFLCSRAVFPQMKKQMSGKIINMASVVAFAAAPDYIHYSTSKGAIVTMTRCLAVELGQYGICVNAIAPGMVDTEAARTNVDFDTYPIRQIPLGRIGQTQDIVGPAVFFASDESNYITGQTLLVDGGLYLH
jgi:3-oxoacyl-[acyl-carrier protein] reductase